MMEFAAQNLMRRLYTGRPYSQRIPFAKTLTGTAGQQIPLWVPTNAFWELDILWLKSDGAVEVVLADTTPDNIIGWVACDGVNWSRFTFNNATVRSQGYSNTQLLLVDTVGVSCNIKGVVYGWELTPDGYYR